jgi:hypothetical protein
MKGWHNKSWTFILQFRCEERAETMSFDQTGSGAQQAFHSVSNRGFFPPGSNNIRALTDQSPVSTATVKNEGSYNSTPSYAFVACTEATFLLPKGYKLNYTAISSQHNSFNG